MPPLPYRGTRYQVLGLLGEGGTGTVWRARDRVDGRNVALKVLTPGRDAHERAAPPAGAPSPMPPAEFRLLASQSHPHIVRVFEHGLTADGLGYFTLEILEGASLLDYATAEAGRVSPATARERAAALAQSPDFNRLILQVLDALDYAHARGLLHLDLKPSNVLVVTGDDGRPQAKLIDFGFAGPGSSGEVTGSLDAASRAAEPGAPEPARGGDGKPPGLSGTIEYLAPERLRGEDPGPHSDLYSLGVLLHEALLGRTPFAGATPRDVLRGHLQETPALDELPQPYRAVVSRLLEKRPERRLPSARSVAQELFGEEGAIPERLPALGFILVGRERLLASLLTTALGSARSPAPAPDDGLPRRPATILLCGAQGSGKTRLLRELEVSLQALGVAAKVFSPRDAPRRPGALLERIVRWAELSRIDACGALEEPERPETMGMRSWTAVARPGLSVAHEGALQHPELDPQTSREQVVSAALERCLQAARDPAPAEAGSEETSLEGSTPRSASPGAPPRVLIVDDLELVDSLSRAALTALARSLATRPGARLRMVLATGEESPALSGAADGPAEASERFAGETAPASVASVREQGARWAAEELEAALEGARGLHVERLPPLPREAVAALVAAVLAPGEPPPDLVERLHVATGGQPLLVEKTLQWLVETGQLRRERSGWRFAPGDEEAPRGIQALLGARMARLGPRPRELLGWLAVWGRPLTAGGLAALLEQAGLAEGATGLEAALDALVLGDILEREGPRYAFPSSAAQAAAAGLVDPREARRRHAVAAEWLLSRRQGDEQLEDIADHLHRAGELRRARAPLLRVAARARRAGALREAAREASRALEAAASPQEAREALLLREDVLGHLGAKEAQAADIATLKELAREEGNPTWAREAALREALLLESLGKKREALAVLEGRVLPLAGEGGAPTPGDEAGGVASADARSEASGGPEAAPGGLADVASSRGRVLVRAALLRLYLSESQLAFAALQEALQLSRAHRDATLEAECRQVMGFGHQLSGEHDRALEELRAALAIRREGGEEHRVGALQSNIGLIHLERGELAAAAEMLGASLRVFRRLGLRRGEAVSLLNLGLLHLESGHHERALDAIEGAIELREQLGDRRARGADLGNLAQVWIELSRPERAAPLIAEAVQIARELENRPSELANEVRAGEVALAASRAAEAAIHFQTALEGSRRERQPLQEALAGAGLARVHLLEGRLDEARAHALAALEVARARGLRRRVSAFESLLSEVELAAGHLVEADERSRLAVDALAKEEPPPPSAHRIWFQRHRVERRLLERGADRAEAMGTASAVGRGEDSLCRAYHLLRSIADRLGDAELRETYLSGHPIHREIVRLHEELQARTRREAQRRERSFHEIARSLHSIVELDPLLERLLELAIETTHADKGLIVLNNPGGDYTIRAARGMALESLADATDICRSVLGDVARGAAPILAVDAETDDRFRERQSIKSFRIRTLMCAPMIMRDEVVGAVYVDGRGASSFTPEDLEYLVSFSQLAAIAVENARLLERLRAENLQLRREVEGRYSFENLVGEGPAMQRLKALVAKVASTHANVLLTGETGTGKEVVARSLHYASDRKSRPFVTVDCGALPESLLESELFGHRRGAFSGALHDRVGLFEEAQGGTLFLDEISNTSLDLQAKLLRALQHGEIRRVGENVVRKVDVRILAAANVDLRSAVANGSFREDLFYRLNVIAIELPPLRDRREDIPLLAERFLSRCRRSYQRSIQGITERGLKVLVDAQWRGNVRELENLIEKAVILCEQPVLDAPFLESLLAPGAAASAGADALPSCRDASPAPLDILPLGASLPSSLEEFDAAWNAAERKYLERLVEAAGGNVSEAARRAGVRNRNTLISRLKRHGLKG